MHFCLCCSSLDCWEKPKPSYDTVMWPTICRNAVSRQEVWLDDEWQAHLHAQVQDEMALWGTNVSVATVATASSDLFVRPLSWIILPVFGERDMYSFGSSNMRDETEDGDTGTRVLPSDIELLNSNLSSMDPAAVLDEDMEPRRSISTSKRAMEAWMELSKPVRSSSWDRASWVSRCSTRCF